MTEDLASEVQRVIDFSQHKRGQASATALDFSYLVCPVRGAKLPSVRCLRHISVSTVCVCFSGVRWEGGGKIRVHAYWCIWNHAYWCIWNEPPVLDLESD